MPKAGRKGGIKIVAYPQIPSSWRRKSLDARSDQADDPSEGPWARALAGGHDVGWKNVPTTWAATLVSRTPAAEGPEFGPALRRLKLASREQSCGVLR